MNYIKIAFISLVLFAFLIGCEIEESPVSAAKIFVDLRDDQGTQVIGARIWLDGVQTSQVTPDTLRQVTIGTHTIATSKPGFHQASQQVTIVADEIVSITLSTTQAPFAAIELVDAPDGTSLANRQCRDRRTVPPRIIGLGTGTWNVSAYLAGHATASPARWTITLAEGDTAHINAQFAPIGTGPDVGQLAPVFALPSDGDSSIYRLQDYRGKIVLVSFFFYTCAPCLAEFPHIQEIYADPEYAGWLEFFGIDAIDRWSVVGKIYRSTHPTLGLQFPLLWNRRANPSHNQLSEVESCPTNILIDPTGMIRYRWFGVTEDELRSAIETLIT